MGKIEVTGSISSLLDFYKHERTVFGRCPHCDLPFRLSDVKLTYGKEPPRDLLTQMRVRNQTNSKQRLEELKWDIEELEVQREGEKEALEQRWNEKVAVEVERQLLKEERRIRRGAVAQSRVSQLGKTLEKMAPMFPGFGHHPYDVRPLFDPIDFVVFDGYFHGEITGVTFVEFKTGESKLNSIQRKRPGCG